MNYRIKIVLVLLLLFSWVFFANLDFNAMNSQSNIQFCAGLIGLVLSVTAFPLLISKVIRYKRRNIKDSTKEQPHVS